MRSENVQYTAKIVTMDDEDRGFRSGMRSFAAISAVASALGLGHHPEIISEEMRAAFGTLR